MADATWYAALLATPFASSLIPLTLRLIPLIAEIAREIQQFRMVEPTPQSTYHFENRLDHLLREMGREIVDWVYNHLEPSPLKMSFRTRSTGCHNLRGGNMLDLGPA